MSPIEAMYNLNPTELEEVMSAPTIRPLNSLDSTYRTGGLIDLPKEKIVQVLGFAPNVEDDPFKVVNSWAFMVNGEPAAIWDYKGSHKRNAWSVYDPSGVVVGLFGAKHYEKGGW